MEMEEVEFDKIMDSPGTRNVPGTAYVQVRDDAGKVPPKIRYG